ncbi:MAG: thiol-disulfide oxidoreductase DCC family protein [Bdellovibrionales bacterium]
MTTANPKQAHVLYDGHCPLCLKSVGWLRKLDWLKKLHYVNVRDAEQTKDLSLNIPESRLTEEMHLVPPNGKKIYHGFGAFRWMAWRLPLLWPIAPFLYLPGVPYLGQKMYLWIARNRLRLVPCHGGVCTLPGYEDSSKTSAKTPANP